MPGLLLSMVKDLPYNVRSAKYMPLSRVQIYSAEDDSMSLNLFVYGEEPKRLTEADVTTTGEETWRAVVCSKSCIVRNGRSLGHGLVRRGRSLGHALVRRGRSLGHDLVHRGHSLRHSLVCRR